MDFAEGVGVNRYTVTNLHALLADNLLEDPRNAGRLRASPVAIGACTYVLSAIPQLLDLGAAIHDPFEQFLLLLVHIPYLQPFVDVNKRTPRDSGSDRRNFVAGSQHSNNMILSGN